jgi:hypothetical protein
VKHIAALATIAAALTAVVTLMFASSAESTGHPLNPNLTIYLYASDPNGLWPIDADGSIWDHKYENSYAIYAKYCGLTPNTTVSQSFDYINDSNGAHHVFGQGQMNVNSSGCGFTGDNVGWLDYNDTPGWIRSWARPLDSAASADPIEEANGPAETWVYVP